VLLKSDTKSILLVSIDATYDEKMKDLAQVLRPVKEKFEERSREKVQTQL
jgi:hypothetical protein